MTPTPEHAPDDASPPNGRQWTEPGAHPVAPGVHRIPLPLPMDGLRAVNVYVLETDDGLTLIDGGWAIEESRTLLEKSLGTLGHGLADIAPLPGHARASRPLHAGGDRTPRVRVARQPRARRQADPRPDPRAGCLDRRPARADAARGRGDADRQRVGEVQRRRPARTCRSGTTRTPGWTATTGSPSATGSSTRCTRPGTPRATTSSPTTRPVCCSPATTCCPGSPRPSASSRCSPTSRSETSWARWPRSARCRT